MGAMLCLKHAKGEYWTYRIQVHITMTYRFHGKAGKYKIPTGAKVKLIKTFPKRKCLIEWEGGQDITMVNLLRKVMKCPNCEKGWMRAFFAPVMIPCDICGGTGELPENLTYQPEIGQEMKRNRIARRITLKEGAMVIGIEVSELSRRERGYFEKEALWQYG